MVKREKKDLPWHGMQFTCGSEDRYAIRRVSINSTFRESILFFTSYFIVSKWWLVLKWNKSFFSARYQLESEGEAVTFEVLTWPYTRVMYHIMWPGSERFQNGHRLRVKFGFCTRYRLFAHLGFFSPRGMCRDKKKGKMCCQLHFKAYFELVRLPWSTWYFFRSFPTDATEKSGIFSFLCRCLSDNSSPDLI